MGIEELIKERLEEKAEGRTKFKITDEEVEKFLNKIWDRWGDC